MTKDKIKTEKTEKTKCGFASIIGSPNAGKSTLINNIVGAKVSIVSPKVQTTRTRVMGIINEEDTQIIFVDTPGIFSPKKPLEKAMVFSAWQGVSEADINMVLVDISKGKINQDSKDIITKLQEQKRTAVLVLNKIDLIEKEKLLKLALELNETGIFTDTYMISALTGDGVKELVKGIKGKMPEGPWMFDEDQISDMPMRLLAAEITREKIFLQLRDELPYSSTVETEIWEEFENGSVKISQVIYIMRDSQKKIILGNKGAMIKKIGESARRELEEILERRVHLNLFVKVRENWANDPERYRHWGLDLQK